MRTDGYCEGCGRTLDEIAGWGGYTAERRRAIMDRLPARLTARAQSES
jgi:uncharacterized protein